MKHAHHYRRLNHRVHQAAALNRAFVIGIALNVGFVVVEFIAGIRYDSMSLLSDAGHNLSDVASLLLALLGFHLARLHARPRYTYGYRKSTILISLLNGVLLLAAVGVIIAEAIGRITHPQPVEGTAIAWTAGIGVAVNGITAWLFMKDRKHDLNVKGAYLHMAADALVSVGVVISGLVIARTGWTIVDPVIGLIVAAVIIASVWSLLRDSLRLALDGVPANIDVAEVEHRMAEEEGVMAIHHVHIWALSTTENALTAHVVVIDPTQMEPTKQRLKDVLTTLGVGHATLEFETPESPCNGSCQCN